MTLPLRVTVGATTYTIVQDQAAMDERRRATGRDAVGRVDATTQQIFVSPSGGPDYQADTLLHEVLHCVWIAAGDRRDKVDNETAIAALTPGLLATLRQNPELVACLLGRETPP